MRSPSTGTSPGTWKSCGQTLAAAHDGVAFQSNTEGARHCQKRKFGQDRNARPHPGPLPQERGKHAKFPGIFTPSGVASPHGDSRRPPHRSLVRTLNPEHRTNEAPPGAISFDVQRSTFNAQRSKVAPSAECSGGLRPEECSRSHLSKWPSLENTCSTSPLTKPYARTRPPSGKDRGDRSRSNSTHPSLVVTVRSWGMNSNDCAEMPN